MSNMKDNIRNIPFKSVLKMCDIFLDWLHVSLLFKVRFKVVIDDGGDDDDVDKHTVIHDGIQL